MGDAPGASTEQMKEEWDKIAERLEGVSKRLGKKLIFMEIGCRSALGCAQMPWDFTHTEFPVNEDEQANFFESSMAALSDKEWFAGYFWWDWGTIVYHTKEEAAVDDGFNIHLKKAEDVVRKWYQK